MWISCMTYMAVMSLVTATFDCPSLFNFYPDVHDCSKFYRCIWGKGASFNCPSETLWSQDLLTCNHAKEVKCNKPAVPQEMKLFEAPDFSVDLTSKKSKFDITDNEKFDKSDYDDVKDEEGSDKDEENEEDDEEQDIKSTHDYNEEGKDSKPWEKKENNEDEETISPYQKKKSISMLSSRGYSNSNHGHPSHQSGYDYQKIVSHLPQQQHYYQHLQTTPLLLPYHQQYDDSAHPQTATYILPPPKFVSHPPPGSGPYTVANSAKSPPWYHNNNLYNKIMQLPPYGGHYFSPYVTDGTYDVVKVQLTPQEFDRLKVQQSPTPQLEKPPSDDDQWRETDLFRAGYGYKIIYHK